MNASEGRRVDAYLAVQPKPAEPTMLNLLQKGFDYLECNGCGRIIETNKLTKEALQEWKFNLMDLNPQSSELQEQPASSASNYRDSSPQSFGISVEQSVS